MHLRLIPIGLLFAAPLTAQMRPIAPASSVLFRSAPIELEQDTIAVDDGMPQNVGMFLGMVAGAGVGYLFAKALEPNLENCIPDNGNCTPPGPKGRVVGAVVFGAVGLFVGGRLAGPHRPRVAAPSSAPPAIEPITINRHPRRGPQDRGVKWWEGAIVGAGVAALGTDYLARQVDTSAGDSHQAVIGLGALVGLTIGGAAARH